MDHVLKSVPSARDTLTIIQKVIDLCKRGEFKLTKFTSNKKDKDLTGSLPIERALGIFWDAENDVIKFKINLKGEPMIR